MKILSGKYRGRNFYMPADIRPTQNITRKAIFDIIGHDLQGISFLELFAGSGAVGIEAISLGADDLCFVEKDTKCADIIQENLEIIDLNQEGNNSQNYEVINGDVFVSIKLFAKKERKFNIVFLDPPYGRGLVKKTLKTLRAYDILQPNCLIIAEYNKYESLPEKMERFSLIKQKKYGKTFLSIWELTNIESNE